MSRWCASGSRSSRQYAAACFVVLNVPRMCTRTTASHSSSLMLKTIRSRRMPATLTSTSSLPNSSMACRIMPSAAAWSVTSAVLAAARPPASSISRTTWCAGPASWPVPSTCTPRSFTTTAAPSRANSFAIPAPMPRPAPVTTATLSSSRPTGHLLHVSRRIAGLPGQAQHPLGHHVALDLAGAGGDRGAPAGQEGVLPAPGPQHRVGAHEVRRDLAEPAPVVGDEHGEQRRLGTGLGLHRQLREQLRAQDAHDPHPAVRPRELLAHQRVAVAP